MMTQIMIEIYELAAAIRMNTYTLVPNTDAIQFHVCQIHFIYFERLFENI